MNQITIHFVTPSTFYVQFTEHMRNETMMKEQDRNDRLKLLQNLRNGSQSGK